MKTKWPIIIFSLITIPLYSQQIRIQVTDASTKQAVPNATAYIHETAQGLIADDDGKLQTSLVAGEYTFEFSSLGYERAVKSVTLGNTSIDVSVELQPKAYQLKEVRVAAPKEDLAYGIMRKAIFMAPFYLNQVKSYTSESYIKGTVKVDKIPRYVKRMANEPDLNTIEDKLFLLESQNQIKFTAPNTYEQHVIAHSSSIPSDVDSEQALELLTTSIYDPNAFGRISPLAPGAFSYYKFTWEGVSTEGKHAVNKIRVQPKKNNPKLVTGWLYIIEDSWNVKSADLKATEMGITIRFTATYHEVVPLAFLPTSYDIDLNINLLGIKATGKYYSSVQYLDIELNEEKGVLEKRAGGVVPQIKEQPQTPKQEKALKKLETLANKENLSTRDAYKMAKLMEEMVEPQEIKEKRESLEIMHNHSKIQITVDSMAGYRDSLYWESVRNLPLRTDEIVSYQIKDSLKQILDESDRRDRDGSYKASSNFFGGLFTGNEHRIGKRFRFGYGGIFRSVPEYNFVDGFWIGQRFTFRGNFPKSRKVTLSPSVYYVTARNSVNWEIDGTFAYNPPRNGLLTVSGGNTTADFNGIDGNLRLPESIASLFFATNPMRFYQKKFITAHHRIDIANGMFLSTGFTYEHRLPLENKTSYSFFGGRPAPNLLEDQPLMPENYSAKISIEWEYTPRYRYYLNGAYKRYEHSVYPTFSVRYEAGVPFNRHEYEASFNRFEAGIRQEIKLNAFHKINYFVNGGGFLTDKDIHTPDYKHFQVADIFMNDKSVYQSFQVMNTYAWSTNANWLQGHLSYTSQYLFLKHLPFLQHYMFDEGLHGKILRTPKGNYIEAGYSAGFQDILRIGVFCGWDRNSWDGVGFTLSIPFISEFRR